MRLSDHHTVLARWVQHRDHVDISYNVAITIMNNPTRPPERRSIIRPGTVMYNQRPIDENFMFSVYGFVYDASQLDEEDILNISVALDKISTGDVDFYEDPLKDNPDKKATKYLMRPGGAVTLLENKNIMSDIERWSFYANVSIVHEGIIHTYRKLVVE